MHSTKDTLGDRMKFYEKLNSKQLMPLVPVCARLDGKTFHNFTKGLERPFDVNFSNLMIATTKYLVEETNALIGYTQSDEISLIWFQNNIKSEIWFNAKEFKMVSILASMASVYFNKNLSNYLPSKQNKNPLFDARVWNVPTKQEACEYLKWREKDATRNSLNMAASCYYSHKKLKNINSAGKHELLYKKGINWNDYPSFFKRGTYLKKVKYERKFSAEEIEKLPIKHEARSNLDLVVERSLVEIIELPPLFKVQNPVEFIFDNQKAIFSSDPM